MDIKEEQTRQSIGKGLHHLALELTNNDGEKANAFFNAYRQNFRAEMNLESNYISPLFEGAKKLSLLLLKMADTGIVTNKGRNGLNHLLNTHEIGHLFDVTYTVDEKQPKPSPEMVVEAMYKCGVDLNKTVLVGDTIYDAQCATNAGISFIGVSWGYNSSEILKQNGASMVINNFSELQTCLNILPPRIND